MKDDDELLDAWLTGDRAAGRELFDRYFATLRRFFQSRAVGDVAELVERTFVECGESYARLERRSNFRTHLYSIAFALLRADARHRP